MKKDKLNNTRIESEQILITPVELKAQLPLSVVLEQQIAAARETVVNILNGTDPRLLIICGPCSIHDTGAAKEYAKKLKALSDKLSDQLFIVMRVYFEKPRTTVGWKGFINDPYMDNSFDIERGLHMARQLLIDLSEIGLPLASEALDPNTPQYLGDLFSWVAIGARTTESQVHREMASGLSMPVGFKNGTDGSLDVAINAMQSAAGAHRFLGINQEGRVCLLQTQGNKDSHAILRGGKTPNYDAKSVGESETRMKNSGLKPLLMIDCSHGNSNKDYRRQLIVLDEITAQILRGNRSIIGVMIESHLNEGNQSSEQAVSEMKYGVSVTDACISFEETEAALTKMARAIAESLLTRQQ